MKKHTILIVLLTISIILLILSLVNFKNPINIVEGIEENYFVLALGIDKGIEEPGNVRITITSEEFESSNGVSSSSNKAKKAHTITSEGKTLFEASRKISTFHNKKVFWSHIKYIIVSEEIASENILNYLDFCIRGHELRFDSTVTIVKGSTAEAVLNLDKKTEKFVPDVLNGIFHNSSKLAISKEMKIKEIMQMFNNKYISSYIPAIEIIGEKENEKKDENETEKKDEKSTKEDIKLELNGFALFDGVKLKCFMLENTARGLNFINGDVSSTTLVLKDKDNKNSSLEILSSNSKIEVELNNDIPKANITLEVSSNFVEQNSQDFSYKEEEIEFITEKQNILIKEEMEDVIKNLQENSLDIIGISTKIYHKYPLKWDNIKKNWKELFKNMEINVTVKSKINRTYHVEEVIGNESDKE